MPTGAGGRCSPQALAARTHSSSAVYSPKLKVRKPAAVPGGLRGFGAWWYRYTWRVPVSVEERLQERSPISGVSSPRGAMAGAARMRGLSTGLLVALSPSV